MRPPLTDAELAAYAQQPETFFGVELRQGRGTRNPFELFEFFYESYQHTPKERLLQFMKDYPDQERLRAMSQEELALFYCEGITWSVVNKSKTKDETRE